MRFTTPALCDEFAGKCHLQIAEPIFKSFGGAKSFWGRITTVKVFEDSVLLRSVLQEKADDRVLVVDGGGSHRCALVGAELARLACDNGWRGMILYGCVRDSLEIAQLPVGVLALHSHPLNAHVRGGGDRDQLITFASVNFRSGYYLYADEDGIVVADDRLL
ncbi:MAG: RraA family protein [Methylococcaceae bacterium]|nr:RraA family protein [Methylococcaceae bacterium]